MHRLTLIFVIIPLVAGPRNPLPASRYTVRVETNVRAPMRDGVRLATDLYFPEGAGDKLTSTISSPIQVHGVAKVSAKRAPALGEHNEEVLLQLGFSAREIDGLHASGAVPGTRERVTTALEPVHT